MPCACDNHVIKLSIGYLGLSKLLPLGRLFLFRYLKVQRNLYKQDRQVLPVFHVVIVSLEAVTNNIIIKINTTLYLYIVLEQRHCHLYFQLVTKSKTEENFNFLRLPNKCNNVPSRFH